MAIQIACLGDRDGGGTNKIFQTVKNNEGAVLGQDVMVEYSLTTTVADQGFLVELVDGVANLTLGLGGQVAGKVETTLQTSEIGQIQIYGPSNVRATGTIAGGLQVVTATNNATNKGHVSVASETTLIGSGYLDAVVGWTIGDSVNVTNASVFLKLL